MKKIERDREKLTHLSLKKSTTLWNKLGADVFE